MTQKSKKGSKKWLFWLFLVVLFVVAGMIAYFIWRQFGDPELKLNSTEPVSVEEKSSEIESEEVETETDAQEDDSAEVANKKKTQYEGADPNKAGELTGSITFAGVSGSDLIIRTNIDQFLDSGTCGLVLKQDGVTVYSETTQIAAGAATSSCQGFNVPISQLDAGNYEIIINLSAGGKTGTLNGETNI